MARVSRMCVCVLLVVAPLLVVSQELDLSDALGDDLNRKSSTPSPKPAAPAGGGAGPRKPVKPKPAGDEFDLADALDPNNDVGGRDQKPGQRGGGFTDDSLMDVINDNTYKPDNDKGGRPGRRPGGRHDDDLINQHDDNNETTAEVGTIAGIVSAVAMALVGAISSYISYQKKKLCFSLQQSLNTDMVKAENPEGVVAAEPQVQQTLLEPPNAEPPTEENTV